MTNHHVADDRRRRQVSPASAECLPNPFFDFGHRPLRRWLAVVDVARLAVDHVQTFALPRTGDGCASSVETLAVPKCLPFVFRSYDAIPNSPLSTKLRRSPVSMTIGVPSLFVLDWPRFAIHLSASLVDQPTETSQPLGITILNYQVSHENYRRQPQRPPKYLKLTQAPRPIGGFPRTDV